MSIQYDILDHPEVLASIFHPRPELGPSPTNDNDIVSDHLITVDTNVYVGARFHCRSQTAPSILFFHGNGEIAADYDELGRLFCQSGVNFLVADYRGYGRSNGKPSVSSMMKDCHTIYEYTRQWLQQQQHNGVPFIIMGRSLGSACALELAAKYKDTINGLIIESGFAFAAPLLRLLGVDPDILGFREEDGFVNIDKIKHYMGPTLIIHAEFDHIIPYTDGEALYKASGAPEKNLLKIEGANHNDILMRGFDAYMQAITQLISLVANTSID